MVKPQPFSKWTVIFMSKDNSPFARQKASLSPENKKFAIIFSVCVLLIIAVSCLIILAKNDFDVHTALGGDIKVTKEVKAEDTVDIAESDKYYLLWCSDSESDELQFMWIVRAQMPGRRVTVFAPSVDEVVDYGSSANTFSRIYCSLGESGLKKAIENTYGIKISKYIGSNTESFKQMINYLGSVAVNVSENIEYKGNFSLILMRGENDIKGDQLYKYLIYLAYEELPDLSKRSDVLITILNSLFVPGRYAGVETVYSRIANLLVTDISIVDYSGAGKLIRYMYDNGISEAVVARNIEELTAEAE